MSQETATVRMSPQWTRPEQVMRIHRLKLKKRQLQARMTNRGDQAAVSAASQQKEFGSESCLSLLEESSLASKKRKNPFRCKLIKQPKEDDCFLENASDDSMLFNLLNMSGSAAQGSRAPPTTFTRILSQPLTDTISVGPSLQRRGRDYIPVDWTLKTKLRFTSSKPFVWSQTLRTCEEASGITGFVRCVSTGGDNEGTLDTSPNAGFHQCCLVWQHPALPWLTLFPRSSGRVADATGLLAEPRVRQALMDEFTESFCSLYQLMRARQCPYFYLCANSFTCLFRAAGIGGRSDINALLTPTTRGFRQLLKEDDVVFSMPLKKSRSSLDPGNSTQSCSLDEETVQDYLQQQDGDEGGEEEEEEQEGWLESMGVAVDMIKRLNKKQAQQVFEREKAVDRSPESLVYAEGIEAQALFNFLLNCKSLVAQTGALAGVTPTLLAPVAFHGATLKPLKVRQSLVKVDAAMYHSMELRGPILPHTLHNLCALVDKSLEEFSATFVNLESTKPFSLACQTDMSIANPSAADPSAAIQSPSAPNAFNKENLCDCGLAPSVLGSFCSGDTSRIQVLDSLKLNADKTYTW